MRRLKAQIVPASSLVLAQLRAMYELFGAYYDEVSFDRFVADLAAKDDVILLIDRAGAAAPFAASEIRGFSTLKNVTLTIDGLEHRGVFSGDTVIARAYWGQRVLGRAFLRYLFAQKARQPFKPFWWFLISKGYKTYLMMANNFGEHYPCCERETPAEARAVLDAFGRSLFPTTYDARTGLITFERSIGQLKPGVADITPALRANPRIAFFEARNPNWAEGSELACLARMTWSMPFFYALKAARKRTARPAKPALVGEPLPSRAGE